MTSTDWGVLVGILAGLSVPIITAGVAIFVKLSVLQTKYESGYLHLTDKLNQRDLEILKLNEQIAALWRVHNHQEGRIYMQDRVLGKLIDKLKIEIDEEDFTPKQKPHYRGEPS